MNAIEVGDVWGIEEEPLETGSPIKIPSEAPKSALGRPFPSSAPWQCAMAMGQFSVEQSDLDY